MAISCSKEVSASSREITSKHHGNFCCLNCLHSFGTENKPESHKNVRKKKNFCNVVTPSEDSKIF